LGGFGDFCNRSGKQGDVGTNLGQRGRGSQADAAACSSDQRTSALEAH
jgi:hypothetical protein